jgi:putative ABC transport system permease protein
MFLALRDIRAAIGRFVLIGSVVGLVTLLIVMLTGLTAGLGKQNTSALEHLAPDRYIFSSGSADESDAAVSFTESSVDASTEAAWQDVSGVERAVPLGITQNRLVSDGSATSVAVFGLPSGTEVAGGTVPENGVLLPDNLSDTDALSGAQNVEIGGVNVPVTSRTVDTEYYSHQDVVWTDLDTWRDIAHTRAPTVLMAWGDLEDGQWDAAAEQTDTTATTVDGSFAGLSAYQSERGSLLAIQGLLYGISALVVVAFLSVWTIQRTRDIAVLRALGASTRYVFGDSLGQAVIVVAAGVAGGALAGMGLGAVASQAVPFSLTTTTILVPGLGVFFLGVVGSLIATRRVLSTDPLTALEASA